MALTMTKGAVRDTLDAFDHELCRIAQMEPFDDKDTVIISSLEGGDSLVYRNKLLPISFKVTATDDRMLDFRFRRASTTVLGSRCHLHDVFRSIGFRERIINFLIDGHYPFLDTLNGKP